MRSPGTRLYDLIRKITQPIIDPILLRLYSYTTINVKPKVVSVGRCWN